MPLFGKKKKSKNIIDERTSTDSIGLLTSRAPWSVQEAYKDLRTNVQFSLPGSGTKVIGVTSAFPGDGKSINTCNLAISFAELKKSVILLDCDMRKPTVHRKLNIPNAAPGLSDVLAGQRELTRSFRRVNDLGIDVLTAGNIPPDPTRLLQSESMDTLMATLKEYYEYVFLDLPPITTVADAAILSKYIDGFLMVVRHEHTEYKAVSDMIDRLKFAEANVLGFIYNDMHTSSHNYYYRYYYSSGGGESK